MPITESWNNVIDATEIVVTPPIDDEEIERLGFPSGAHLWLSEPSTQLRMLAPADVPFISSVLEACSRSDVALVKVDPEDVEFSTQCWFVEFGSTPRIARRLDLEPPDWKYLERELEFVFPPSFVAFAEAWPGLLIGGFDGPQLLLPSGDWLNHDALSPYDGQGRALIDVDLFQRLKRFLLFQIDYWAKAKLLGASGTVWEYDIAKAELTDTGREFDVWLDEALRSELKC